MANFRIESLLSPVDRAALWEVRNEQRLAELRKLSRRFLVYKIAETIKEIMSDELNRSKDAVSAYSLLINNTGLIKAQVLERPKMQDTYIQGVLDTVRLFAKTKAASKIMAEICDAVTQNKFAQISLNRFSMVDLAMIKNKLPTQDLPSFINKGDVQKGYEIGIEEADQLILAGLEGSTPLALWRMDLADRIRGERNVQSYDHDRKRLDVQVYDRIFAPERIGGGFTLWLGTWAPKINVQLDYGFGEMTPQASILIKPL